MTLFEVPGWAIPADPVSGSPSTPSKKRKRVTSTIEQESTSDISTRATPKKHSRGQKVKELLKLKNAEEKKAHRREQFKSTISRPRPLGSTGGVLVRAPPVGEDEDTQSVDSASRRPGKRVKWSDSVDSKSTSSVRNSITAGLTSLQKGMKESLNGARFRLINESLYKSESTDAVNMMRENPKVYEEYHVGFRHQVQSWPTNPVRHYVSIFTDYPTRTCIADLGCGDAELARALIPKGINVFSFDLVSDGEYVVEADICTHIPLPGSENPTNSEEKTMGRAQIMDVAVCALSLMGTNWPGCLREAWRILRPSGELHIAEVASRLTDLKEFITLVSSIGFKLRAKDDTNTHFTLFEFVKVARRPKSEQAWTQIMEAGAMLKPCEYKRR